MNHFKRLRQLFAEHGLKVSPAETRQIVLAFFLGNYALPSRETFVIEQLWLKHR